MGGKKISNVPRAFAGNKKGEKKGGVVLHKQVCRTLRVVERPREGKRRPGCRTHRLDVCGEGERGRGKEKEKTECDLIFPCLVTTTFGEGKLGGREIAREKKDGGEGAFTLSFDQRRRKKGTRKKNNRKR